MDTTLTEALTRINASFTSTMMRDAVLQSAAVLGLDLSSYAALQSAAASAVMVDLLVNKPATGYPDAAGFVVLFGDLVHGEAALFAAVDIANTATARDDSLIDEVRSVAAVLRSITKSDTLLSGQKVSALTSYADALLSMHDGFDHAGQYGFVSYLLAREPASGYSSFSGLMNVVQANIIDAYRAGKAADLVGRSALDELNLATDAASLQALLESRAGTLAIQIDPYLALSSELRAAVATELWAARPLAGFDRVETLNSHFATAVQAHTPVVIDLPPLLDTPDPILLVDTAAADLFSSLAGQLVASDPEAATLRFGLQGASVVAGIATVAGQYGSLSLDTASGAYVFAPNRTAIEARSAAASEQFSVSVSDGSSQVQATLTVNVSATNDTPTGTLSWSGRPRQGEVLSVAAALADAEGLGTLAYQWLVDGVALEGATASSLDLSVIAVGATVGVQVSYTDQQGNPESMLSTALTVQQSGTAALSGQVYHWKSHALLQDVALTLQAADSPVVEGPGAQSVLNAVNGLFQADGLDLGPHLLQASRALGKAETGSAVNSTDALAALKIAVGRNPNPDGAPLSPYQLIAADVNEDGKVNSSDALAILKMAVKRTDAPAREWLFVSEATDFWDETANGGLGRFTTTRSAVVWEGDDINVDVAAQTALNLVAVLKGDVNGSWAAPAGSSFVPMSHFDDLAATGLGPLAQWGVLPV